MTPSDLLKTATSLRKQGRSPEALALLRDALRRGSLDAEATERAGRFIGRELAAGIDVDGVKPWRVHLLGQCTTSWLVPALTAIGWGQGVGLLVTEGGFDNILQDLSTFPPGADAPDVVALLPWSSRFLESPGPAEERVEDELTFWQQAWGLASGRLGARLLQVGYDWVIPGPLGYCVAGQPGGPLDLVRQVNARLRRDLPRGAYFLDLEAVSGTSGRSSFYDMRRYHWTKQPFSEEGTRLLAEHLFAGARALMTGPKKVLVLDLDNTLWGGVVGEVGPLGVALGETADGEAFRAFQKHAKGLAARGVVLAVASKNNPEDGREPFEKNPEMALALDDFGAWEVNWEPKGTTIARVAEALSLGLDSFVFFDDNPAEREQVRQALPDVAVAEAPADPAEFVRALQAGLWFEAVGLTSEDRARAEQYATERRRRELQEAFTSLDDYLRSLEMAGDLRPIDEADLTRVVQLLGKTNQFNLTTRRHSREDVLDLIGRPGAVHLTLRVRDRFGDHGLVAALIAVPDERRPDTLRVDTCLMSCRVIGRTVEQFLFASLMERARELGYARLLGEYIPTRKNALVARLLPSLGFAPLAGAGAGPAPDGAPALYEFDLAEGPRPATFVVEERMLA